MLGNHVRKVGTQRENSQYCRFEVTGLGRVWVGPGIEGTSDNIRQVGGDRHGVRALGSHVKKIATKSTKCWCTWERGQIRGSLGPSM